MFHFNYYSRFLPAFALLLFCTACTHIFETDADVQARKALHDLAHIQEQFFKENGRYAQNLVEIAKHNLKYHSGVVYLEIESAGKDGYRAVALPAESTTARVFAFDTAKGGFYEMDEEEVSSYVLGALNFIRGELGKKNVNDLISCFFLGILLVFGFRFWSRFQDPQFHPAFWAYFASMIPMGWSLAVLNYLEPDIVLSGTITGMNLISAILSLGGLAFVIRWLSRHQQALPSPLIGLASCSLTLYLIGGTVMVYVFNKFYL
ncbi:MAG: hypothetical protein COV67_06360 [Nitrospinae bacterium CG11_big_fil_rev_8_21_14_0_20_56_8]|nr:MAG: hypothetical protein COV67_06360 [Nitrospinae bacterium CG11_big_fil_rev_8_21_14_0_20_56_8]